MLMLIKARGKAPLFHLLSHPGLPQYNPRLFPEEPRAAAQPCGCCSCPPRHNRPLELSLGIGAGKWQGKGGGKQTSAEKGAALG